MPFTPRGCFSGRARRSIEARRCLPPKPPPGFSRVKASVSRRGALLATRDALPWLGGGLLPELPYHRPQRGWLQLVRPRRSGRVAPRTRCRAATRVVANALASKEAPLGLHWQPPALGLPQACPCDARRSPPSHRRVTHGHVNLDGPPRVHLRLWGRADGRRPHREGDADL